MISSSFLVKYTLSIVIILFERKGFIVFQNRLLLVTTFYSNSHVFLLNLEAQKFISFPFLRKILRSLDLVIIALEIFY